MSCKYTSRLLVAALAGSLSLAALEPHPSHPEHSPMFEVVQEGNPVLRINELFPAIEDLRHPDFSELRRRYDLDAVVAGLDDEFGRILALRHWIKQQIRIEDDHPTPVARMHAFDILDAARAGGGFHCAHFSIVQDAVFNAYGYVTRRLGAGDGLLERGRHHGVNEVWVNDLCKWVLIDAKYDLHFERDGLPLSALEVRDEVLADGGTRLVRVYGPERAALQKEFPEAVITYRWVVWELSTNRHSNPASMVSSAIVMLDDEFTRTNIWYRNGKPHWAYDAKFFVMTPHRQWIEWTPNVIKSWVTLGANGTPMADIRLGSCTPNFSTYRFQQDDGAWNDCADRLELPVPAAGLKLAFRTRNLAGVEGPIHRIHIRPSP